jgi:hypothetical protein
MGSSQQGAQYSNGGARRRVGDLPYFAKGLQRQLSASGVGVVHCAVRVGLIIAAFSVLAWTVGRADYVVLFGKRFETRQRLDMFSITATCALMSTVLMALAILIALFKFGTL